MRRARKCFRDKRLGASLQLLALLAILSGCASAPLTQALRPAGRRVVLLLDASTSMRKNDPEGIAPLGAQLVLGLVGSDDNVGVITYAASAEVQRPLSPAGTQRQGLGRQLAAVERNGITDFATALERARAMLAAGNAPRGSALILLTDGVPYRGRRRRDGPALKPVLDQLAAKGWRIFAIALGAEAQDPFLARIVAITGGGVFPAARAEELPAAFADVATEALGYLRAERGGRELRVLPHTGRLAVLAQGGVLEGLTHEGQPREAIRTQAGDFSVGLVEQPEAGQWKVEASQASEVLALLEPRFSLEFVAGKPPERVVAGEEVVVSVRLVGEDDALNEVRDRLLLRAKLSLGERALGTPRPLKREGEGFAVSFRAPRVQEESSLSLVVEARIQGGDERFVLRRTRALTVAPADGSTGAPIPLAIGLEPTKVERAAWSDAPAERLQLKLQGDPQRAATLRVAGQQVELDAGASRTLEVPLRAGRVALAAEGPDGARWKGSVQVTLARYALEGPRELRLPDLPAGVALTPQLVELKLSPQGTLQLEAGELRGPGGARLPLALEGNALSVSPAADLPPGDYRGALKLEVEGVAGLAPRELPVSLKLLPPVRAPEPVALRGSWGWTTTPVEVAWPAGSPVEIEIEPSALAGAATIHPELDIRIEPLDGWKGDALGAAPRRFAFSVYLSSDLPAGRYQGQVAVRAKQGGRRLEIPVTLDLKR